MTLNKLDLEWAINAKLPPIDFVLPGLMPGNLGLLVAPGATGKSTLALDIAISIALGRHIAGGLFPAGKPGKVVLLAAEENSRMLAERLRPMLDMADQASQTLRDNLVCYPNSGESSILVEAGKPSQLFAQLQESCQGSRLIVLDPLRRLHDGDENCSSAMTSLVVLIEQLAKSTGAAVIGVHHSNRSSTSGSTSQHSARGSSALVDAARWQANLSVMDESAAQALHISESERKSYVALDFVKTNYMAPTPRAWLKRQPGGRLAATALTSTGKGITLIPKSSTNKK